LIRLALEELKPFTVNGSAKIRAEDLSELFFLSLERAIPQYDHSYGETLKVIHGQLERHPQLHLTANYLKGVSLNDCIENAYQAAQSSCVLK
jgi:protoporphyrinogen oxidase